MYNLLRQKKGFIIMKAVITVIGKDMVGILAKVSQSCADANANVIEVTQSVLQDYFAMIMLVDISKMNCELTELTEHLQKSGDHCTIQVMNDDLCQSLPRRESGG